MADQFIYNLAETWNSGVTTFDLFKVNITDAGSAADSRLVDLQRNGISQFRVGKNGEVTMRSVDAGAGAGPVLTLDRQSGTPATADILGQHLFAGRDSAGNTDIYAAHEAVIVDPASGSEDARFSWRAMMAGALTSLMTLDGANGLAISAPFTSRGIDDNAPAERMDLSDGGLLLGDATGSGAFHIGHASDAGYFSFGSGQTYTEGGCLLFYGSASAVTPSAVNLYTNNGQITYTVRPTDATPSQTWYIGGSARLQLTNTALLGPAIGQVNLGTLTQPWPNLFLGTGSTIDWGGGNAVLTHSAGRLTLSGGILDTGDNGILSSGVYGSTADGADNGSTRLAGGGSASALRGAYVRAYGNQAPGVPGNLVLSAGNIGEVPGAIIQLAGNTEVYGDFSGSTASFTSTVRAQAVVAGTFSSTGATTGFSISSASDLMRTSVINVSGTSHIRFHNPNGQVGAIQTSGSTTAFITSSDERLKEFIAEFDPEDAYAIILADPVKRFAWKRTGEEAVGWFAQQSYTVSRDLATPGIGAPEDEDYTPWGVDQGKRTPYLWAATKGLLARVTALEARLAAGHA